MLHAMRDPILPDLLQPGLDLVFCGTAAGRRSAEEGAYYAHPGNLFWRTLHAVALTPRLFAPAEYPLLPALGGCLAKAAVGVVTAPVKVAGKAVDMATTSQSESDEKRGRELRKREERLGKLERKRRKLDEDCRDGESDACAERDAVDAEMEALLGAPESH